MGTALGHAVHEQQRRPRLLHAFIPITTSADEAEAVFWSNPLRWLPVSDVTDRIPVLALSAGDERFRAACTVGAPRRTHHGTIRWLSWEPAEKGMPAIEAHLELRARGGGTSLVLNGRYDGEGDDDELRKLAYGAAVRFLATTAPALSFSAARLRSMQAHPSARHRRTDASRPLAMR